MSPKNTVEAVIPAIGAIALGLAANAGLSRARVATEPANESSLRPDFGPAAQVVRHFGASSLPAVSDRYWLLAILNSSRHGTLAAALHAVTELDPAFMDAYFAGANLLAVLHNDGSGAKAILERGESFRKDPAGEPLATIRNRVWTSAWAIPLLLAYVHLFELDDLESASASFLEAAAIPGSPSYLGRLEQRLRKPGGKFDVGLRLLNFMLTSSPSEESRQALQRKRDSLYLAQYLFDLNRALSGFASRAATTTPAGRRRIWPRFLREEGVQEKDPWGGTLFLTDAGEVDSTTPRVPVFGLR